MRVTKQRRHRKALRFYTVCYGFRPPFKILCDGTFLHHLLVNGMLPGETALTNILGAAVKIFTTRCVLAELRSLGKSYSESYHAASKLITARCDHEKRKSAIACITEIMGQNNVEHFFVATQDADFRKQLQEIPGVPTIYALRNALFLERPSSTQLNHAKAAEAERSSMTDLEYKMLKVNRRRVVSAEAKDSLDGSEDKVENPLGAEDRCMRPGKKRAKGPNPLSCKKKKVQVKNEVAPAKPQEENVSIRSRKRKRTRRNKKLEAMAS